MHYPLSWLHQRSRPCLETWQSNSIFHMQLSNSTLLLSCILVLVFGLVEPWKLSLQFWSGSCSVLKIQAQKKGNLKQEKEHFYQAWEKRCGPLRVAGTWLRSWKGRSQTSSCNQHLAGLLQAGVWGGLSWARSISSGSLRGHELRDTVGRSGPWVNAKVSSLPLMKKGEHPWAPVTHLNVVKKQ